MQEQKSLSMVAEPSSNQTQLPESSTTSFTLGASNTTVAAAKKNAPQTASEMADKRSLQLLGDQNFVESSKRGRTDFAESLRKTRR